MAWRAMINVLMGIKDSRDIAHDIHPLTITLILHLGVQGVARLKLSPGRCSV
jgi:hypothetical protein